MSSTAENPSAGRTGSCPYTLASPGMSPRKSRTAGPFSFKSTPPVLIGQIRACRGFRRFRPPFIRTLVRDHPSSLRDYAVVMGSDWAHNTWSQFPQSVQTGESGFEALFGQPCYPYLQNRPADLAVFNAAMTALSKQESTALQEA